MELLEVELYFNDAGSLHSSAQDVLFSRQVVLSSNAAKAVEKTATEFRTNGCCVTQQHSNKELQLIQRSRQSGMKIIQCNAVYLPVKRLRHTHL